MAVGFFLLATAARYSFPENSLHLREKAQNYRVVKSAIYDRSEIEPGSRTLIYCHPQYFPVVSPSCCK